MHFAEDEILPQPVNIAVALCTSGCFKQASFLRTLLSVGSAIKVLPVISDATFIVPLDDRFDEICRCGAAISAMQDLDLCVQEMQDIINSVFTLIAVVVNTYGSTNQFDVQTTEIARRLMQMDDDRKKEL